MKKIMIISIVLVSSIALRGCSSNESTENSETKNNQTVNVDIEQGITERVEGSYSKFAVENQKLDVKSILKLLISEKEDSIDNMDMGTEENTIETNGIKHTWSLVNNTFMYYNDKNIGIIEDKEKAENKASEFVKMLGWDISNNTEITTGDDGSLIYTYTLQHNGVELMGNYNVYLPDNDETPVQGAYIEIGIGKEGIIRVYISGILNFNDTIKSYDASKDFIDKEKLSKTVLTYYKEIYADLGEDIKATLNIESFSIIYMPYREKKNIVLIPVYDVTLEKKINGNLQEAKMLIDAVDSYVYYAE